jgi:ABC-type antimicrobial peptide transport system permease subunit
MWFKCLIREILYRKGNFLFSLLAIIIAVAMITFVTHMGRSHKETTDKIFEDTGNRLLIVPEHTDMDKFWINGFSRKTMPQEYFDRLIGLNDNFPTKLVARLYKSIKWKEIHILLTGILPSSATSQVNNRYIMESGELVYGHEAARLAGISVGDTLLLLDKKFKVREILPEFGDERDIRVYGNLNDIQNMLGLEDAISEIEIVHTDFTNISLDSIEKRLDKKLPETQLIKIDNFERTKLMQETTTKAFLLFITSIVIAFCGGFVAILTINNTRERKREILIMRISGHNIYEIFMLILSKAVLLGLLGSLTGFAIGIIILLNNKSASPNILVHYHILGGFFILVPLFILICSLVTALTTFLGDISTSLQET